VLPAARCFPPPWLIEEHNDTCFIVKNTQGTGYLLPTNFGGASSYVGPIPTLPRSTGRCAISLLSSASTIQALTIVSWPVL